MQILFHIMSRSKLKVYCMLLYRLSIEIFVSRLYVLRTA